MTGSQPANPVIDPQSVHRPWRGAYIAGAAAALIAVVFFRRNCGTELVTFNGFGIWDVPAGFPITALEWFQLFQDGGLLGLALFDLIDLINYLLVGLILIALYGALRTTRRSATTVATAAGLVGIAAYVASNQAFAMLSLSDRYAAAATDAQRAMLLAAGEALLAVHNPGTAHSGTGLYVSLFLVLVAGLILSIVMLRSDIFNRATAYLGILANAFGLSSFALLAFPPTVQAIPHVLAGPTRLAWYVLIALQLIRLARKHNPEGGTGT